MSIIRSLTLTSDLAGIVLLTDPWLISENCQPPGDDTCCSSIEFLNVSSRGNVLYPYISSTAMTFNTPNSNVLSLIQAPSNRYTTTNM